MKEVGHRDRELAAQGHRAETRLQAACPVTSEAPPPSLRAKAPIALVFTSKQLIRFPPPQTYLMHSAHLQGDYFCCDFYCRPRRPPWPSSHSSEIKETLTLPPSQGSLPSQARLTSALLHLQFCSGPRVNFLGSCNTGPQTGRLQERARMVPSP